MKMHNAMMTAGLMVLSTVLSGVCAAENSAVLHLKTRSLVLSGQGMFSWDGTNAGFSALSTLEGMIPEGALETDVSQPHSVTFRRTLREEAGANSCQVEDQFSEEEGSIRWTVKVQGKGSAFGPEVSSAVRFPLEKSPVYWTTWAMPESESGKVDYSHWEDPFQFVPMTNRTLVYGGEDHTKFDSFSIPCAVAGEAASPSAMMILHAIGEPVMWMKMKVGKDGSIAFARSRRQVSSRSAVTYTLWIQETVRDWRPALGWVRSKFPRYCASELRNTWMIAGNGGYSEFEGELNVRQLHDMAFQFNWKAGMDYVYMGMYLPRTSDVNWEWTNARFFGAESETLYPTSLRNMEEYARKFRTSGFHVLNYMNPAEVGLKVSRVKPPRKAQKNEDLWKDPNDFVHYEIGDALLFPKGDDRPWGAWEEGVLMDIGVPSFRNHLVDQVKRHLEFIPSGSGACFDRTDFLRLMNWKRDDGLAFSEGALCGSLAVGWVEYMKQAAPLMHAREKAIYCNPLYRRIDLYENIDGFYDEIGTAAESLNICSVMAFDRPYVAWTQAIPQALDDFFQMHLYMGAYMTAPLPYNNHTIKPDDARALLGYQDYGLLFEALRFRKWNTEPNSLTVSGAKANLFEIPGGLLLAVIHGKGQASASLQLSSRNPVLRQAHFTEVLYPGEKEWQTLALPGLADGKQTEVPLKRGCALVRVVRTAFSSESQAFFNTVTVGVRTAIPEAKAVYRKRMPKAHEAFGTWSGWQPLPSALVLRENTWLQTELRDSHGTPIPDTILEKAWVNVPVAPPQIIPEKGFVDQDKCLNVRIVPPACFEGAVIRYTVDGGEPDATSPLYQKKIELTQAGVVRAKAFYSGSSSSTVAAKYEKAPPMPPKPDVYLSDLKSIRETIGVPGTTVQRDLSWEKKPMKLKGYTFAKGLGTCANSDIVFAVKEEYQRVVAVVGVDDEMKNYPQASVKFRVYAEVGDPDQAVSAIAGTEKLLFATPVMRANETFGIDVSLPQGTRIIRLNLNDAGDGIDCDHGDWANAGFILKVKQ